MAAYIKGAAVLSPQKTFTDSDFLHEVIDYTDVNYLKCIEPVYRDFIDPMVSRRMSRIVKMGVCGALKCLHDTGIRLPDAIIAGTGLGCLEDTEKFLASIYTNDEKLLNPTPFIQSTHNTVAGAVALAIKCHNYNATYTHRGFSFENALQDALLQLAENPNHNILAGGFDELTDTMVTITKRIGLWKNHPVKSSLLMQYHTRGSLPGEGVAFFMLSGHKGINDLARLKSITTFNKPQDLHNVASNIGHFLSQSGISPENLDLVILGLNGDSASDQVYYQLSNSLFSKVPTAIFKHLCGEYDTSSAFAMWLASVVLKQQKVPDCIKFQNNSPKKLDKILIYNHLRGVNHALYILERC